MKLVASLMIAGILTGPALAVETEAAAPAAETAPAAAAETPAPAAVEHAHAKPKAKAHEQAADGQDKDKKRAEKAKPALTKQAYVRLLAAEIKRHTPKASDSQIGSIHVAFTVGSAGRVVSHKVQTATNPALEPVVAQILAAVHTAPPPGGSFSAVQEFNFH